MNLFRCCLLPLFLVLSMLLAGCGTLAKHVGNDSKGHDIYDRQGLDVLVEDASRKTTIIKDKTSLERFCRSPNPDFATGESNSVALGLGSGPSIGTSSGAMIDSLGGRSSALLITRELMYRACELTLNLDADSALAKEIYWRFLGTIELAIKTQAGNGVQGSTVTTSATASVPAAMPQGNASPSMLGGADPSMGGGGITPPGYPGQMPGPR